MLKVFFVVVLFNGVSSLVCFKTLSVQQEVPETYQFSFYEAYDGEDCFLCSCTKSRLSVGVGTRLVKKLLNKTVSVCCEGYVEDVEYDGAGLKCIPVCNPPCQNGFCRNPNECACDPGYAVDPYGIKNKCTALCLEGCSVPECLPCDSGNTTDMCHGNCHNGICVAPGICHCDPGYTRQSGICEPICASCEHGTCIAPDVCECDFGYTEECNSCKPFCFGCEHGKCKSPGQCECNAGYKAINRVCEPYCEECDGKCVAPNTCVCEPGWYWRGGHCLPHCSVRCGNGTCVAPDVCSCYSGYQVQLHDGYETALCQPVCADCPHECIAPGVCASEAPHGTESTTEDGRVCDCNHCGNLDRQSDKIPCTSTMEADGEVKEANGTDYSVTSGLVEKVPLVVRNVTLVQDKPIPEAKINTCSHLETARHHWIYGAIITVQFLIILITLAILLKKTISDRLKIRKFVPKDIPNSEVAVEYTKKIEDS